MPSNGGAGEDSRVPWTDGRSNQSILKESVLNDAEAETPILRSPDAKI